MLRLIFYAQKTTDHQNEAVRLHDLKGTGACPHHAGLKTMWMEAQHLPAAAPFGLSRAGIVVFPFSPVFRRKFRPGRPLRTPGPELRFR